ncbi:MAG: hypothetical protein KC933_15935 [Myxococcales bacterium]|nr:hypothetical protein [Myxococcales bacterium]
MSAALTFVAALGLLSGVELDARGFVAADGRVFAFAPGSPEQASGNAVSMVAEPQLALASDDGVHVVTVQPFLRLDPLDQQRSHWDLRRAEYTATFESWEAGFGVGQFRWGVLESYGLTDVINQADYLESLDKSQRLGQPYLQVGWLPGDWAVRLYALPGSRPARFPGERGRLRLGAVVDPDQVIYESSLGQWQPSFALRVTGAVGDFDLGLGLFTGNAREPRLIAQLTEDTLVAAYDVMHQASADVQWTLGALTLKAEGLARLWSRELAFFWAGGVGLDYSFFDVAGSGVDVTLAAEYLHDTRPVTAPVTFFQHDVFAGLRLMVNDSASTLVQVGAIVDVLDGQTYARLQAARRFGESWKLFGTVNAFVGPRGRLESTLLREHYAELRIVYYL